MEEIAKRVANVHLWEVWRVTEAGWNRSLLCFITSLIKLFVFLNYICMLLLQK